MKPARIPTRAECEAAESKAYEAHYQSDWIDDVEEADLRDMLRRLWGVVLESSDPVDAKYFALKAVMERAADLHSQRAMIKNAPDYLEG